MNYLIRFRRKLGWGVLVFLFSPILLNAERVSGTASATASTDRVAIARILSALPLSFEANQGQSDPKVRFAFRGAGYSGEFTENEADLLFSRRPNEEPPAGGALKHRAAGSDWLRMRLVGTLEDSNISGEDKLPGTVNYFVGNDSEKWRTGIPTFARVKYSGVYRGTDLVYYGAGGRLEFDFQLAPGADPSLIRIKFGGAKRLRLDSIGNLEVVAPGGEVEFHKPAIYQVAADGSRNSVRGWFVTSRGNTVGFRIGKYDRSRPLVIDPVLNYSTYIGPGAYAFAVAVNGAGEAFITGIASPGFPTTPGSFQTASMSQTSNDWAPFVAKFNSTASALEYCTYLSGSGIDEALAIAVDSNGNAFVAGEAGSKDFPVTLGALQPVSHVGASSGTGFVTVLNSTGTGLIYSTYLGGSVSSLVAALAIDSSGNAYVTGGTQDIDFPTTAGAFQTAVKKSAVNLYSNFVAKVNPTGTALVYSTYLAGSGSESTGGIAVDSSGTAFIAGATTSTDFPVTQGAFQLTNKATAALPQNGFVTHLNAAGSALLWSTYLGGSFEDELSSIAVDASGSVYVTGGTASGDFPLTPGAFQTKPGGLNAVITKIKPDGSGLIYSARMGGTTNGLGGSSEDYAHGIVVDAQGNAVIAGSTTGLDFPVTPGAFETDNLSQEVSAEPGGFVTKINSTGTALLYSTFLSGTGDQTGDTCDCIYAVAMDPASNVYVTGITASIDFPTTLGVFQPTAGRDMFITEFKASEMTTLPAVTVALTSNANPQEYGKPLTFTSTVSGTSGSTPTGTVGFNILGFEIGDNSGLGLGPWTVVPLDSSGKATFTPAASVVISGDLPVAAHYLGDVNNAPGTGTMTETVTPIPTAITETASPNPITWGQPVTFTATVLDNTGKPAPGSVSFVVGNIIYSGGAVDSSGTVTWNLTQTSSGYYPLQVGTTTVKASYSPSLPGNPYASNSTSVNVTANPIGTTPQPTFSPPAGTYTTAQSVVMSDSNTAATIYYTTDGTTPAVGTSASLQSGNSIEVNTTSTIQALAVVPGYSASPIASATYTLNLPPPDFSMGLAPMSLTVYAGQSGSAQVSVTAENGFTQPVSLSCSGLPAGVSCSFVPASVSPGIDSTVTIAASTNAGINAIRNGVSLIQVVAIAALFPLLRRRTRKRLLLVLLAGVATNAWVGCGGGQNSSPPPIQPTTSTVTISGTSGSLSHSVKLTLTLN